MSGNSRPAWRKFHSWIAFDSDYLYLSGRCWDSAPPEEWTANEYRRDTNQLRQNDMFGAMIDTFHDRRNGFNFYTNPLGARAMYLYQGGRDTMFRIHGTNQPQSIGHAMSSGCVRMMNHDVIDLYSRVPVGTKVIVRQAVAL